MKRFVFFFKDLFIYLFIVFLRTSVQFLCLMAYQLFLGYLMPKPFC